MTPISAVGLEAKMRLSKRREKRERGKISTALKQKRTHEQALQLKLKPLRMRRFLERASAGMVLEGELKAKRRAKMSRYWHQCSIEQR